MSLEISSSKRGNFIPFSVIFLKFMLITFRMSVIIVFLAIFSIVSFYCYWLLRRDDALHLVSRFTIKQLESFTDSSISTGEMLVNYNPKTSSITLLIDRPRFFHIATRTAFSLERLKISIDFFDLMLFNINPHIILSNAKVKVSTNFFEASDVGSEHGDHSGHGAKIVSKVLSYASFLVKQISASITNVTLSAGRGQKLFIPDLNVLYSQSSIERSLHIAGHIHSAEGGKSASKRSHKSDQVQLDCRKGFGLGRRVTSGQVLHCNIKLKDFESSATLLSPLVKKTFNDTAPKIRSLSAFFEASEDGTLHYLNASANLKEIWIVASRNQTKPAKFDNMELFTVYDKTSRDFITSFTHRKYADKSKSMHGRIMSTFDAKTHKFTGHKLTVIFENLDNNELNSYIVPTARSTKLKNWLLKDVKMKTKKGIIRAMFNPDGLQDVMLNVPFSELHFSDTPFKRPLLSRNGNIDVFSKEVIMDSHDSKIGGVPLIDSSLAYDRINKVLSMHLKTTRTTLKDILELHRIKKSLTPLISHKSTAVVEYNFTQDYPRKQKAYNILADLGEIRYLTMLAPVKSGTLGAQLSKPLYTPLNDLSLSFEDLAFKSQGIYSEFLRSAKSINLKFSKQKNKLTLTDLTSSGGNVFAKGEISIDNTHSEAAEISLDIQEFKIGKSTGSILKKKGMIKSKINVLDYEIVKEMSGVLSSLVSSGGGLKEFIGRHNISAEIEEIKLRNGRSLKQCFLTRTTSGNIQFQSDNLKFRYGEGDLFLQVGNLRDMLFGIFGKGKIDINKEASMNIKYLKHKDNKTYARISIKDTNFTNKGQSVLKIARLEGVLEYNRDTGILKIHKTIRSRDSIQDAKISGYIDFRKREFNLRMTSSPTVFAEIAMFRLFAIFFRSLMFGRGLANLDINISGTFEEPTVETSVNILLVPVFSSKKKYKQNKLPSDRHPKQQEVRRFSN